MARAGAAEAGREQWWWWWWWPFDEAAPSYDCKSKRKSKLGVDVADSVCMGKKEKKRGRIDTYRYSSI